jgi:hypothetical protein
VHLTAFSESILHGRPYAPFDEAKALATDGWKVVVGDVASGRAALYAPDQRRPESEDVAARHPEVTERLRRELGRIYRDAAERAAEAGVIEFTDEQRAGLGKLGY